jgi:hypothetical protein
MKIYRSIQEPIRSQLAWEETWEGADDGLIKCWENGRILAELQPDLAAQAKLGQLVPLAWKGGLTKALKVKKYGTFFYLASWQGLRGEDLNLDTDADLAIRCSFHQTEVIFTSKFELYAADTKE